ncbi:L,D-transpeptidase family protein [Sulfurovum sp.]|uniref:L,D-transpeptidase family protein n=1 Tax=Sulfurovum sp. TaxID=1969726 RepID=UPI002867ED49|nr:L,D-transpeptidase family protein [Sulfurovum sp.]
MISIKHRARHLCIGIGLISVLMFTQGANANVEFNEEASTVMMDSLQIQPKNSFLRQLYTELLFVPVWIDEESLSSLGIELFSQIKEDKTLQSSSKLYQDALRLEEKAAEIYTDASTVAQKVDLEFKMSQLYSGYADYTLYGSINWGAFQDRIHNLKVEEIAAAWVTYKPKFGAVSLLEGAVMGGGLKKMFKQAEPQGYGYKQLREALIKYIEIEKNGGWESLPIKETLNAGNSYDIIPSLRERLRITEDYTTCSEEEGKVYDTCLKDAVMHFQKRHGLVDKGVMGPETIAALNVPVKERIEQMRLNLDRIKWLNERNEKRHIMINIPAFTLFFEEDKALRQEMKVITGTKKNPTPIFSNRVQTIVLNPYWNVPKSIIQKEMIPKLLRNSNAMKKEGIEIHNGWGEDAEKISASSVDWGQYLYSKSMPYRFAQVPGNGNALGRLKFLFPNKFAVYMHDTPTKHLFDRNVRAFSHGCIRLSKPKELMETFSTFNETVDMEKAEKQLEGKKNAYLNLPNRVPIDVIYLTSYVDYDGVVQFRNDIYDYDKMQLLSYRKW